MADNGQGATPDTGAATAPPTDDDKPKTPDATSGDGEGEGDEAALAEAGRKAIQREREKARAADERAKTAEDALKAIQEKDLPEAEKAIRKVAELEKENQRLAELLVERDVAAEVSKVAAKLGVVDVDVTMLLLREDDAIDFDSEGKPTNVEAAIKNLIKSKPYLARPTSAGDAGAGTRPGGSPGMSMNDQLRRAAGRGQ